MFAPGVIARREIRDTLSDWRVVTPMLVLAVLFPAIAVAGIRLGLPILDRIDPEATRDKIVPFGAMIAAFFPISFSLVVALESFVGEKERNTLEALLVMPLTDAELFLGKFLAVIIPPFVLATIGLSVFSVGLWLVLQTLVSFDFLLLALLLSLVKALAMVAGAVVVSSQTTSVRAANLLASFIILPMALVMQGEVLLVLTGRGHLLWLTFAALCAVSIILLRMGISVFNREEILARENDQIHLGRLRDTVVDYWRRTPREIRSAAGLASLPSHLSHGLEGQAVGRADARRSVKRNSLAAPERGRVGEVLFTLVRIYRIDVPDLLAIHRRTLFVAGGLLLALGLIGYGLALRYPIEVDLPARLALTEERALESIAGLGPGRVFLHNVEIVGLTALLGIITFGVAPVVILGAPFAILGFLAGQAAINGINPWAFLVAFVLPHGLVEIPALWLAAAFGLNLGLTLMAPPRQFGFGSGLLLAVVEWLKIAWLIAPLLALAAVIEVTITPRVVALVFGT